MPLYTSSVTVTKADNMHRRATLSPDADASYVGDDMTDFFPRATALWTALEKPNAFRRLTMNIVEMALVTGVVLRLFRSLWMTHGSSGSWLYEGTYFVLSSTILLGMLTLHVGNYTLKRWAWRAPVFALLETAGEMLTSLILIVTNREPMGSTRAELHDWPSLLARTLTVRMIEIVLFAVVLAGVVRAIRFFLIQRAHNPAEAEAIREELDEGTPIHGVPPIPPP